MRARPEAAARPNRRNSKSSTQSSQSQGRQARDIFVIAALHRIASTIGKNTDCRHAQSATDLIDVFNLLHFFVFFLSFCSKMSPLPYTRYSPKLIGSTVVQERSQQMTAGTSPLSFVTCASNDATLRTNLLASPCLAPESAHQVVAVRNCPSAADGLNIGIARAETEWVVCHHNSAQRRIAAGVFRKRSSIRPQMERQAAGRHTVCDHRPRRDRACPRKCDHGREEIHCVYFKLINNIT